MLKLTDLQVKNLKAKKGTQKISDGNGLFLQIEPNGSKLWRWAYRFEGKQQTLSMGKYPDVSLSQAREKVMESRKILADGINPSDDRKAQKAADKGLDTFSHIAHEWHQKNLSRWKSNTAKAILLRIDFYMIPSFGALSISNISTENISNCINAIIETGKINTAHKCLRLFNEISKYARLLGYANKDTGVDLIGSVPTVKTKHHSSFSDPKQVKELLLAIDSYCERGFIDGNCLKFILLTFIRSSEARNLEWSEVNLDNAEVRIPGEKMKNGKNHIVPLSKQAITILEKVKLISRGKYVFTSISAKDKPLSNSALLMALRRMCFSADKITVHGFRGMASTILNAHGYSSDYIEKQLSHSETNSVRKAYNHADYLQQRKEMMQWYADYLDSLR